MSKKKGALFSLYCWNAVKKKNRIENSQENSNLQLQTNLQHDLKWEM